VQNGIEEIYEDLKLPPEQARDAHRPYVLVNMVASLDGRAAVGGKASGIGGAGDRRVMRTLRSRVDAVMIGGGTLRAERLSLGLDPEDPKPVPLAVVITSTGDAPLERNLVRDHRQRVLVLLGENAPEEKVSHLRALAEVRRVPAEPSGAVDLRRALRMLKACDGIDVLLCEGGPTLNRALISYDLVDEILLTLAPTLIGGPSEQSLTLLEGPALQNTRGLKLLSVNVAEDEVFLRYSLHTDAPNPP